tara:strand:+ start:633 stop:1616 length:984 start_codon:yes stop_codon:yes gene_type:complete
MTLVFPKSKPIGVNSANSREAIRGEAAFPTRVIDYLKLDIYSHEQNTIQDTIFLYLPKQLSEDYQVQYQKVTLGPAGAQAIGMAGAAIDAGGIGEGFGQQIEAFAKAAKPALGFSAGSKAINTAIGLTGQAAGGLDTNSLAALTTKRVFNPYEEAVFQGTDFRLRSFKFDLVPKSADDVSVIYEIVHKLRLALLPGKDGQNWLTLPEYFRISIVRYSDNGINETITNPQTGGRGGVLNALMQFPTKLVLKNLGLNLAPQGNYSSIQSWSPGNQMTDFGPTAYSMQLDFQETSFLTKESFGIDSSTNNGYFNYENSGPTPPVQTFVQA